MTNKEIIDIKREFNLSKFDWDICDKCGEYRFKHDVFSNCYANTCLIFKNKKKLVGNNLK